MARPDLNLLYTLDVLLTEGSVARAAKRLHLSPSAMSRALARLRDTTGDPLLVRAGRGLVPTPRALELRDRVGEIVRDAETVLRPAEKLDLGRLDRTFVLRVSDGFVENFGPGLIDRVGRDAPGVRLRFVPKLDRDSSVLRDGSVDLDTGVVGPATGPEVRMQVLFEDDFIGVVRADHPLAGAGVTAEAYAAGEHVFVSRRGVESGPVDERLEAAGLRRNVVTIVSGFAQALALARSTDLIATVPRRHTENLRTGMSSFALPVALPGMAISLLWHPRNDADAAHRWLRGCVREVCVGKGRS